MDHTMVVYYGYARHTIDERKNAPTSLAISMAMRIRRYGAERIAQYGRSWATLDATATGRRGRASIHPISPQRTPWSSILA